MASSRPKAARERSFDATAWARLPAARDRSRTRVRTAPPAAWIRDNADPTPAYRWLTAFRLTRRLTARRGGFVIRAAFCVQLPSSRRSWYIFSILMDELGWCAFLPGVFHHYADSRATRRRSARMRSVGPATPRVGARITGMDVDHPEYDQGWDRDARSETKTERLDRNWASLLQELRVTQTGVQLLTGFLLTLPFQQRFDLLDEHMRMIYLITVGCSIVATVLLIAPVGMHRLLFRRHRLTVLVSAAHRCAYAGLVLLGLALVGVSVVIFYAVSGATAGIVAGVVTLVGFSAFWVAIPLLMRSGEPQPPAP